MAGNSSRLRWSKELSPRPKLYLVTVSNKMEVKELVYNIPILVNVSPDAMKALLTADGLISTFGGIALLCL